MVSIKNNKNVNRVKSFRSNSDPILRIPKFNLKIYELVYDFILSQSEYIWKLLQII